MPAIRIAETAEEIRAACELQLAVFSVEQGIPADLCRARNDEALHILAVEGDELVGTARIISASNGEAEIARVAVLPAWRGQGLGVQLVAGLEQVAERSGVLRIVLHPHKHLQRFYEGMGYRLAGGGSEVVGGHELVTMAKVFVAGDPAGDKTPRPATRSRPAFQPMTRFTDKFPAVSGNAINGLGETARRKASPFFWHPPERQTHAALQKEVTDYHRQSAAVRTEFSPTPPGGRGPDAIPQAKQVIEKPADEWAEMVKEFALANESDLVGITAMRPDYIYEGYQIAEPWVITIGVAMDYDELSQAPPSFENPSTAVVVAKEYNRAARACRKLANFILSQGYYAKAYQGPYASALNMLPAAIASGFGELGKHGSIINRTYGSSFRLSAVTTTMPLVGDRPDTFGADDYCLRCKACSNGCPPGAIADEKRLVRGVVKWYVDFDKCIPYFGEALGCAICLSRCPWSRPGNSERLIQRLAGTKENVTSS